MQQHWLDGRLDHHSQADAASSRISGTPTGSGYPPSVSECSRGSYSGRSVWLAPGSAARSLLGHWCADHLPSGSADTGSLTGWGARGTQAAAVVKHERRGCASGATGTQNIVAAGAPDLAHSFPASAEGDPPAGAHHGRFPSLRWRFTGRNATVLFPDLKASQNDPGIETARSSGPMAILQISCWLGQAICRGDGLTGGYPKFVVQPEREGDAKGRSKMPEQDMLAAQFWASLPESVALVSVEEMRRETSDTPGRAHSPA